MIDTAECIRIEMREYLETATLNLANPMNNRYWDRWVDLKGILGDYLEERSDPGHLACRAEWWIDMRAKRQAQRSKWLGWIAQLPEGADAYPFGIWSGEKKVKRGTVDVGITANNGGLITYGSLESVQVVTKAAILNANPILHFAPRTLKIICWDNTKGSRYQMAFTHKESRGLSNFRLDTDIAEDGFLSLWRRNNGRS